MTDHDDASAEVLEPPPKPAAREGSGALVVRNTLINALGSGAGLFTTLLLTPVLIHGLGGAGFGVWTLAVTLTFASGYLSLTDLGLQQAAVRGIADARSRRDVDGVSGIFSTTLMFFLGTSMVIGPLIIVLSPAIVSAFGVGAGLRDQAVLCFRIVGASILLDLPSVAFRAVLEGAQRFVVIRSIDLARIVAFSGAAVVLMVLDYGLSALAIAYLASSGLALAGFAIAARVAEPHARLRTSLITRARSKELLKFGGALFVLRIVGVVYRQMDRVIIAVVLGVASVTLFEISNKIQGALTVILSISSAPLLPAAAFIAADRARLRELYLRGTCYTLALALPVTVAVMLFAHPMVIAWVGERWENAVGLTRLFVVWIPISALSTVGWTILVAQGYLRSIVLLNIGWVVLNLALSIALVYPLGVAGVIWGTLISMTLLTFAYTWLFLAKFDIPLGEWVRRTIVPNLPGLAAQLALGLPLVVVLSHLPDIAAAAVGGIATTLISFPVFLFVGLDAKERAYLLGTLGTAVGRGTPSPTPAGK